MRAVDLVAAPPAVDEPYPPAITAALLGTIIGLGYIAAAVATFARLDAAGNKLGGDVRVTNAASDSGNGTSGVRRVIGPSPSGPAVGSRSTKLPIVCAWCAEAVNTILLEPGIGCIWNVQCGDGVALPQTTVGLVPSGRIAQRLCTSPQPLSTYSQRV